MASWKKVSALQSELSRLRLCAIPWTTFVLTIHTVWSISVPIALIEVLGPQIRSPTDVLITH
ncbi:MAG: hypothetical protein WBH94_10560 [Methanoculleus sp.]